MKLTPLFLYMNAEKHRWAATEALHVMDCTECGCCNYICPARLPLVQTFRMAKFALREAAERTGEKEVPTE